MSRVAYHCSTCGVRIVEHVSDEASACPVCRVGSDPSEYPPLSEVRGDFR